MTRPPEMASHLEASGRESLLTAQVRQSDGMTTITVTEAFRAAIGEAGLTPPLEIIADGQLHRFASNGDPTDNAGWYVLHGDGLPAGSFGCWRSDVKENWCAKTDRQMTEEECAQNRRRIEESRRQRDQEEKRRHEDAAELAQNIWDQAPPAPATHPYLQKKQVQPHGLRVDAENQLIVPVRIDGSVTSLLFISPDHGSNKKFLPGGTVKGASYTIGELTGAEPLLIVEGFATGASVHEATSLPVVVAFNAGNLLPVAKQLRDGFPAATIVLCADNDIHADGKANRGVIDATAAADAIKGVVAIPELNGRKCDFNDVAVQQGHGTVRAVITAALPPHILDAVHTFLGRFISYPSEHAHRAHTLWIAHTHLMAEWESTPRLAFLSPEPGSGKTRALECTEILVPRPVEAINTTAAYLFRKISDPNGLPTVLHDEIDTLFGPKAKEHEEIRGVINAGHRRGASAGRCVVKGKQIVTEELPAFCAFALAGLGFLPETILTRSVIIKMRRRAPGEIVQPYRRRFQAPEGHALRDRLAMWATSIRPTLNTTPTMPIGITDRPADVWESLLSVADAAGGDWPTWARVACVALVADAMGGTPSLGLRLLVDIKSVFGEHDALTTAELISFLISLEESPWGDLKGKPIDARRLANLLKPYGISSKNVRIGGSIPKGYAREDFYDAWLRYLPSNDEVSVPAQASATSATSATPEQDEFRFDEDAHVD